MLSFILMLVFWVAIVGVPVALYSQHKRIEELRRLMQDETHAQRSLGVDLRMRYTQLVRRVTKLEKAAGTDTITIHLGEPNQFGVDWAATPAIPARVWRDYYK